MEMPIVVLIFMVYIHCLNCSPSNWMGPGNELYDDDLYRPIKMDSKNNYNRFSVNSLSASLRTIERPRSRISSNKRHLHKNNKNILTNTNNNNNNNEVVSEDDLILVEKPTPVKTTTFKPTYSQQPSTTTTTKSFEPVSDNNEHSTNNGNKGTINKYKEILYSETPELDLEF